MTKRYSVLIADDHALSLKGLQRLLEETGRFAVLPPVPSGLEAIAVARAETPDLAVLDHAMPGATGLEVLAELRRWAPRTRVALLTGSTAAPLLRQLAESGVDGLFFKSTAPEVICEGLLNVARGRRVLTEPPQAEDTPLLTGREAEVLDCIAAGLTNPATAEQLGISVKTVESHRGALMRKLEVHSTASLLIRAVQTGLITP